MAKTMKITGALIHIGKMQSGIAEKTGNEWSSQEFTIKPEGKWAKPACFRVYKPEKDLTEEYALKDFLEVSFNIASREYKGKYYTNLDAWEIRKLTDSKEELDFDKDKGTHIEKPEAVNESDDLPF